MENALKNLTATDLVELNKARDEFRRHAAQNTGFFGIRQTATSRKFDQSLKKSNGRQ